MKANECMAGFACLDITPPLGVGMIGAGPRTTKGVLDPLYVNAVAFGQGEKSAVLLVCDLLGMYGDYGDTWPAEIARQTGIAEDSLILCCTHTHTGPAADDDEQYHSWLLRRLVDAAQMALDDCRPVKEVLHAEGRAPGLVHVRRYLTKSGEVVSFPKSCDPALVGPAGEPDESMRVVRILREGAHEITLVNFQSHPDNVGGEYCSADYPGALRRRVEEAGENTRCVFLDGAEGQLVKGTRMKPHIPKSHENAVQYGVQLAEIALELARQAQPTGRDGLVYGQKVVQLGVNRNGDPSHMESGQSGHVSVTVSAIAFCGLLLVGIPGEPFCELGQDIRANADYSVTCVLCQANGSHGYFPVSEAYDQPGGSYEPSISHVCKGSGEVLVRTAEELVSSL